ncbi:cGMP-dependent protein kinase [Aureococcus anophagefferens]|nr:cGMP-dependent protein kinase [Aureococcus anophagefferens]
MSSRCLDDEDADEDDVADSRRASRPRRRTRPRRCRQRLAAYAAHKALADELAVLLDDEDADEDDVADLTARVPPGKILSARAIARAVVDYSLQEIRAGRRVSIGNARFGRILEEASVPRREGFAVKARRHAALEPLSLKLFPRVAETVVGNVAENSRRGEAGPLVRGDDGYYERRAVELACDLNGAFTRLCMEGVYDATRKRVLTFCGPTVVDLKAVRNHGGVSFKTNPTPSAPGAVVCHVGDQLIVNGGLRLEFALRHPVAHMDAASSFLLAVYSDPKPTDTFGSCDELLPTKNECHLGRYNEEVFENAHILNKKLLHVAVFPAPTHVLQ